MGGCHRINTPRYFWLYGINTHVVTFFMGVFPLHHKQATNAAHAPLWFVCLECLDVVLPFGLCNRSTESALKGFLVGCFE